MSLKQYRLKDIYKIAITNGFLEESISYRDFYYIVRDFNKQIADRIISNQYQFKFGIGQLEVIRDKRKGYSIDWFSSKKLRQEIIDRGETPFSKENAPNGIKWFVYFDSKDYFKWNWFKDKSCDFVKNIRYYIFKPMTGNRKKVGKVVKENPFADIDYGIHR